MKLECGKRARLRRKRKQANKEAQKYPHLWFAWRPVKVGVEDCRWLETVKRQRIVKHKEIADEYGVRLIKTNGWEYTPLPGPPPVHVLHEHKYGDTPCLFHGTWEPCGC